MPPEIDVAIRCRSIPLAAETVAALARMVLEAEGAGDRGLSIALVDDLTMARLHGEFLDDPTPTDVMAFPLDEDGDPELGEVVVSLDTAIRQAPDSGLEPDAEALLYVIHGTLHLLGYDDHEPEPRARMHARQDALLEEFLRRRR